MGEGYWTLWVVLVSKNPLKKGLFLAFFFQQCGAGAIPSAKKNT